MKYLLLALLLLPFPAGAASIVADYSANLQGCWDLDESSGTRQDAHPTNNNDLTDNNTVTSGVGKFSNAADFELSTSEYLSIADASQTGLDITGNLSMSMWVNVESAPSGGAKYVIMGKYVGGTQEAYALAYRDSGGLKIDWQTNQGGAGSGGNQCVWSVNLGTATYHHLFLFADMPNTSATLWVDGVSQGTVDCGTENVIANNAAPFCIGASCDAGTPYDGRVDVASIWNADKSANVAAIYNAGAGIACVATAPPPNFGDLIFFE